MKRSTLLLAVALLLLNSFEMIASSNGERLIITGEETLTVHAETEHVLSVTIYNLDKTIAAEFNGKFSNKEDFDISLLGDGIFRVEVIGKDYAYEGMIWNGEEEVIAQHKQNSKTFSVSNGSNLK